MRTILKAMVLALAVPVGASAQATPTPMTAGWQDGLVIQSADGDHRLVVGLVAQVDGRFSLDDPLPITNTFTIRKLRPTLTGRVGRFFDFKVMPDFGSGQTVIADAFVEVRFSSAFRVRTGKDKTPVGYELLQGDAFVLFPERSIASSLVPNRDIGILALGDLAGGRLYYAAGVFNGIPDGSSGTTEVDANSDKDLAGRFVLQPFRVAGAPATPVSGLGFQVGGSRGGQNGPLPSFRTSVGQTYFSYAPGTAAAGTRTRVSPAAFYYYRSLGAFAEYMRSAQAVIRDGVTNTVTNTAWEATVSYVVTGEAASDRGVRPRNNFNPSNGQWGALQLLARYAALSVDDEVFVAGLGAPTASDGARSWTVGANWYPNPWIKWYATFERTTFGGDPGAPRPSEDVILFRFQLGF